MLCTYSKSYFRDIFFRREDVGAGTSGRPGASQGSGGISDGWAARKEESQRPEARGLSLAVNITEIKPYLCRITVPN